MQPCTTCTNARDAIQSGHLECLSSALEEGHFTSLGALVEQACFMGSIKCLEETIAFFARAPTTGRVPHDSYDLSDSFPNAFDIAIKERHIDCVRLICRCMNFGFPNPIQMVADEGDLDSMKWLHEQGDVINDYALHTASRHGHLECMRYAHEQGGAGWSYLTACGPAQGHLDALKYAHGKGAKLNESVIMEAARGDHLECLQYIIESGCKYPVNDSHIRRNKVTIIKGLVRRRSAATIVRAWRTFKMNKRMKAVSLIEDAFITWSCRPGEGRWYKKALASFLG